MGRSRGIGRGRAISVFALFAMLAACEQAIRIDIEVSVEPDLAAMYSETEPGMLVVGVDVGASFGTQPLGFVCGADADALVIDYVYDDPTACVRPGVVRAWLSEVEPEGLPVDCGLREIATVERGLTPADDDPQTERVVFSGVSDSGCRSDETAVSLVLTAEPDR